MDLNEAKAEVKQVIYSAAVVIFEKLESEKLILGNGHHAAQKLAEYAAEELESRWK